MLVDATNSKTIVTGAIRQAAKATGASFDYLWRPPRSSSNLNATASASTSSAKGLFQFIEQTWLAMVKGGGVGARSRPLRRLDHADAVGQLRRAGCGGARRDPQPALRPTASAALAGAFTQRNASELTHRLNRPPSEENYIAHFLGSGGAARLTTLAANWPASRPAAHFP